jgi:hypothetical protein
VIQFTFLFLRTLRNHLSEIMSLKRLGAQQKKSNRIMPVLQFFKLAPNLIQQKQCRPTCSTGDMNSDLKKNSLSN